MELNIGGTLFLDLKHGDQTHRMIMAIGHELKRLDEEKGKKGSSCREVEREREAHRANVQTLTEALAEAHEGTGGPWANTQLNELREFLKRETPGHFDPRMNTVVNTIGAIQSLIAYGEQLEESKRRMAIEREASRVDSDELQARVNRVLSYVEVGSDNPEMDSIRTLLQGGTLYGVDIVPGHPPKEDKRITQALEVLQERDRGGVPSWNQLKDVVKKVTEILKGDQ